MVVYSKYLKSFPKSQYPVPLAGKPKILVNGSIAYYDMAFLRVLFEFGNRCTAVKLSSSTSSTSSTAEDPFTTPAQDNNLVIFNPMPYGAEAQSFLRTMFPEIPEMDDPKNHVNVKYLIAPDYQHHMGLKGWKEAFPGAQIIGVEGLPAKKREEGVTVDYVFTNTISNVLVTDDLLYGKSSQQDPTALYSKHIPLPRDLLRDFDFVYLPHHPNKELVALHKATKTLLTADLFLNMPATCQYEGVEEYAKLHPTSGWSSFLQYLGMNSWLSKKLTGSFSKEIAPGLQAIYDWKPEVLVPAHGDIVSQDATERFGDTFGKFVKTTPTPSL